MFRKGGNTAVILTFRVKLRRYGNKVGVSVSEYIRGVVADFSDKLTGLPYIPINEAKQLYGDDYEKYISKLSEAVECAPTLTYRRLSQHFLNPERFLIPLPKSRNRRM